VRRSEFTELADHVFGPSLARTYTHDLVLEEIGGLSAADALERGVAVRAVWTALCDAMEVPETARWEIPLEQRRR
jgi:ribulose 1,5-bisphosphate carboxylase large subunit-like protein